MTQTRTKEPSTALAVPAKELDALEELASKYALAELNCKGRFERAFLLAEGIQCLREAVKPHMPKILALMGTPLGFVTDRDRGDRGQYPLETVAECLVEATLRGVYPVGNEFNIIAGRCYITKAGYARLVRDLPGLTDLKLMPGIPRTMNGGAIVPFRATWRLEGKAQSIERDIPVKMDKMTGADALLGKATRKILAAIHSQVTGSTHSLEDSADSEGELQVASDRPTPLSRTHQVAAQLEARAQATPKPDMPSPELHGRIQAALAKLDLPVVESVYAELGFLPTREMTREQGEELLAALERVAYEESSEE